MYEEQEAIIAKLEVQLKEKEQENEELHAKIKFLEGQVDAYQYCMNCRR